MKYDSIVDDLMKLLSDVPKIQDAYRRLVDWTEPSPHVVFGDVLLEEFLLHELATMQNKELLERIFRFFEAMASCKDEEVRNVLTDTVLERLGDDKQILERARALMGPKTVDMSHEIERFWGRE